ncbi:hypothetical protein KA111_00385 [Candidatus Woesebacteria bacterium]|nr:hypothetical protein [Candidatus Woesebacteria bacterium]
MNENEYFSEESLAAAKAGVNRMRREISIAIKNGLLIGGKWPENYKESHYLQYAPSQGRNVTVQINGDVYQNVTHIEYGRPCGVLILKHEDGRTDFYPEEINNIEIN